MKLNVSNILPGEIYRCSGSMGAYQMFQGLICECVRTGVFATTMDGQAKYFSANYVTSIQYLGHKDSLQEIEEHEIPYYRSVDVIVKPHWNPTGVFVVEGADRDYDRMRRHFQNLVAEAKNKIAEGIDELEAARTNLTLVLANCEEDVV